MEHHRKALPELERKRKAILQELASLGPEKQKLSRWLRGREVGIRINSGGARYFLMTELRGCCFDVLKAAGVAVPPTLRR